LDYARACKRDFFMHSEIFRFSTNFDQIWITHAMHALPGSLARQPCPAALPGSLARQPCPAALPSSLARQFNQFRPDLMHALACSVTALYYSGRSPNCNRDLLS
jgi:hypothetical protein